MVLSALLLEEKTADQAALDRIREELTVEMDKAVEWAIASPYPGVEEVDEDVYAAS